MDFKVKCVRYIRDNPQQFTVGKVYSVVNGVLISDHKMDFTAWSDPRCGSNRSSNFESLVEWFRGSYEFELVEEKKMFTKKDLKNGDVIVRRNGNAEIAIVDQGVFVTKGGFNRLSAVNDDLTTDESSWDIVKVIRPTKEYHCQFATAEHNNWGNIVYDRERDTKRLYNGKVVCIDNTGNERSYTVGKIYQFVDGKFTADNGAVRGFHTPFTSFEEWAAWTSSEFIEVKE